MLKIAPLPASLMLFSMLGFIIVSIYGFYPDTTDISEMNDQQLETHEKMLKFKHDIAIAADIVLVIMFLASWLSTSYAPIEEEIEMEKRSKLDPIIKK